MTTINEFVHSIINLKASDECKALTSFRTDNIPKWFKLLELQNCIVTDPLRLSFVGSDFTLAFRGPEEQKAKNVITVICDYIRNGGTDTIVMPMSFGTSLTYHTNVIIINPLRHEFERFEPYGQYRRKAEIQSKAAVYQLDEAMNTFMRTKLYDYCPFLHSFNYITTADFCPLFKAPQSIQEKPVFDKVRKNETVEFVGFCTIWSMMYAHLRILFPEMSGEQVLTELLSSVKRRTLLRVTWDVPTAMTKLVQRYACYLLSL